MQFTIAILDESDGWLVGQLRELPGVLSQGRSEAELIENLRDALREYLASFEEKNIIVLICQNIQLTL